MNDDLSSIWENSILKGCPMFPNTLERTFLHCDDQVRSLMKDCWIIRALVVEFGGPTLSSPWRSSGYPVQMKATTHSTMIPFQADVFVSFVSHIQKRVSKYIADHNAANPCVSQLTLQCLVMTLLHLPYCFLLLWIPVLPCIPIPLKSFRATFSMFICKPLYLKIDAHHLAFEFEAKLCRSISRLISHIR